MPSSLTCDNFLLKLISKNALAHDCSSIQEVSLVRGQTLFEKEVRLEHVYFPISAVASRIYLATCGRTAEMGMVGREGVVGISLFLGESTRTTKPLCMPMEGPCAWKQGRPSKRLGSATRFRSRFCATRER